MRPYLSLFCLAATLVLSAPAHAETNASPDEDVALASKSSANLGLHLGIALGAGMLSAPLGLGFSAWLGTLSNSLVFSALPVLLSMGLVAPTLTVLAAWLTGRGLAPGRYGFWLPWAATVLVNAAALVVAGFAGMSFGLPLQVLAFSLVEGAVLGATAVGTMRLFPRAQATGATLASFAPGISRTHFVPLAQGRF